MHRALKLFAASVLCASCASAPEYGAGAFKAAAKRECDTAYAFSPPDNTAPIVGRSGSERNPGRQAVEAHREVVGTVSATVLGARKCDGPVGAAVMVRLRVARHAQTPITVDLNAARLVTADGIEMSPSHAEFYGPPEPAPGGAATSGVTFTVPPPADLGDLGLSRVVLRVSLEVGGEDTIVPLVFRRDLPEHPWVDPWGRTPLGKP